MLPGGSSG
uniref:Uncharacterized protein n=1 Tax=Arundo donax TaxID=35708 RepID=A0A0A9CIL2_ARUDO